MPVNSVATTGDFSSFQFTLRSLTQFEWISPVMTMGFEGLRSAQKLHQAVAADFVAAPLIHGERLLRAGLLIDPRHQHLVGDDVPFARAT